MEYKKYIAEDLFTVEGTGVIPAIYLNADDSYGETLKTWKQSVTAEYEKAAKFKKWILPVLCVSITLAAAILILLAYLIWKHTLQGVWGYLLFAVIVGMSIGAPLALYLSGKKKKAADAKFDEYAVSRITFKSNTYLYRLLVKRDVEFMNIIMGGGQLTVFYVDEHQKLRVENFTYEEWKDDPDLQSPFLVIENDKLYGRGETDVPGTTFSTSQFEEKKKPDQK